MVPLPQSDRAARRADMVLGHQIAQRFTFMTTSALIDISRGSTALAPDAADELVQLALEAVISHEVMAAREGRR